MNGIGIGFIVLCALVCIFLAKKLRSLAGGVRSPQEKMHVYGTSNNLLGLAVVLAVAAVIVAMVINGGGVQ